MRYLPAIQPHIRIPTVGLQDRDNFITNLATLLYFFPADLVGRSVGPLPPSKSVKAGEPVVTLEQIKDQCRIEYSQTAEDAYLLGLEMAARIHTANVLQQTLDPTIGENIKQAILFLIAHWYRNREAVGEAGQTVPLAYEALLWPERNFLDAYGTP